MSSYSLSDLLSNLHSEIENKLQIARTSFNHPGSKGDASESVWLELLNNYLPKRYEATSGFVVDSNGKFSHQIDVIIYDRQYSPFIFNFQGKLIVPSESVYAVFEAKQSLNAQNMGYAKAKIESVRLLHRTSLPVPHAGGIYDPKPLIKILGGILTLESDWTPEMGPTLKSHLNVDSELQRLNIGCVARHGMFYFNDTTEEFEIQNQSKAATAFLFKLIAELQGSGTVPMIDIQAYGKWLLQ